MSVVVAIKNNGKVYLGCDSQITNGGTRSTLNNPNNYKIWKVKEIDNCLMGSVGNVRDACVIRTMDSLVTEYDVYKERINFELVVNRIVPNIINRLRDFDYVDKNNVFDFMESAFLFVYKDKVYVIGNDGSVIEVDDCVAIGSGKKEALGSLLSTDKEEPVTRIIKAIKASVANDIYVDYPIIVTDSENTKFDIVTEKNEKEYIK